MAISAFRGASVTSSAFRLAVATSFTTSSAEFVWAETTRLAIMLEAECSECHLDPGPFPVPGSALWLFRVKSLGQERRRRAPEHGAHVVVKLQWLHYCCCYCYSFCDFTVDFKQLILF